MSKIKEIIVASVLPAFKAVGKVEMESVLSGIKVHNTAEIYQNTLQGLHSNFSLLKEAALKPKPGLMTVLSNWNWAVKDIADADGIILS
jgi:hypothetical protein